MNSDKLQNAEDEVFIKIKANHIKTLYPKGGIGDGGQMWGIVIWQVCEIEKGEPVTNYMGEVTITGTYEDNIDPNLTYNILAKEVENEKYGIQYELVYYNEDIDFSQIKNQRAFLRAFMSEGQVEELYKVCPNPLEAIKNHDVNALKQAKGIKDYIANCVIERFEKCKDMSQVYIELDKVGLSQVFIAKLIAQYKTPQKIIDVVKQNPYQLIKDIAGVGFFTADRIALKSAFTAQDVRRIKAYITWFLESQGEDGHSYVSAGELMGSLYEDLGGKNAVVKIIYDEETGEETNNIALAMKELQEDGTIIVDEGETKAGRRVYLTKYWRLEREIAYHLKRLLGAHNEFVIENFDEKIHKAEEKQRFKFTQEQIDGIKLGLKEQVCVISGLAGSGKSSLVTGILAVLDNYNFAQCALSGKAAARLQEVTGQEGFTIHRLLGYQSGSFSYTERNPLPYKIIILDEVSMVGGEIFLDLIKAIPTGSKLLMLGDGRQLESIGLLNLASDMMESKEIPTVELKEVHRQAAASGILTTAYDVRNQIQLYEETDYEGVEVRGELQDMILDIRVDRDKDRKDVVSYFEKYYNSPLVNQDVEKIQIIAPVKERGDACVFNLNQDIQELLNPPRKNFKQKVLVSKKKDAAGNDRSFWIQENDKVMCIRNNYNVYDENGVQTSIFNGWTGLVKKIERDNVTIKFDLSPVPVVLREKDVKDYIVLGYACTTHKYQGSGCPVVIGVVDNSTPPMMLCTQQVYTMLTRAKKLCVLVAQTGALRRAINSNYVSTKRTFLKEFLAMPYEKLRAMHNNEIRTSEKEHREEIKEIKNNWKHHNVEQDVEEMGENC